MIVIDECHRSIYNVWRQVLEYFDAFLIGLTATPSKQTVGSSSQNLVMEYPLDQAVADGVNVDFDVYRIRTVIAEQGSAPLRRATTRGVPRSGDPEPSAWRSWTGRLCELRSQLCRRHRHRNGPDPHGHPAHSGKEVA